MKYKVFVTKEVEELYIIDVPDESTEEDVQEYFFENERKLSPFTVQDHKVEINYMEPA